MRQDYLNDCEGGNVLISNVNPCTTTETGASQTAYQKLARKQLQSEKYACFIGEVWVLFISGLCSESDMVLPGFRRNWQMPF